jgi:hypothetical protein
MTTASMKAGTGHSARWAAGGAASVEEHARAQGLDELARGG